MRDRDIGAGRTQNQSEEFNLTFVTAWADPNIAVIAGDSLVGSDDGESYHRTKVLWLFDRFLFGCCGSEAVLDSFGCLEKCTVANGLDAPATVEDLLGSGYELHLARLTAAKYQKSARETDAIVVDTHANSARVSKWHFHVNEHGVLLAPQLAAEGADQTWVDVPTRTGLRLRSALKTLSNIARFGVQRAAMLRVQKVAELCPEVVDGTVYWISVERGAVVQGSSPARAPTES
ncbi:MAG: hypothetical protein A3B90_01335 [Candidatus Magasanikbacteria bacterium RIFCSPHIGHO2_02_FULL_41_13]|uniref:Uncharacterized protein n=1 Tax=Candidatus Magasanikbacteria bacterium RIFCSPHIGHO2_02_FULL_41_13 TaxID=1798676 RepID=A0A1F6M3T2_9BACT|nr:MAG: hypothetical protein A3B90_01335 [Candidatus Magasanikbacteria bacterium RIFCSPHIGHO2_02_FULL_41_13]